MLVDLVNKYYDKKYDLNCAECMLVAANEEYDLNISKQTLKTLRKKQLSNSERGRILRHYY